MLAPVLAVLLVGCVVLSGRRTQRASALAWTGSALLVLGATAACHGGGSDNGDTGGNNPAPATGTPIGTCTVTATSGTGASAQSRSVPLTLTVAR